jgi:hypothetical protein
VPDEKVSSEPDPDADVANDPEVVEDLIDLGSMLCSPFFGKYYHNFLPEASF